MGITNRVDNKWGSVCGPIVICMNFWTAAEISRWSLRVKKPTETKQKEGRNENRK